jgi:hypothetical protein
MDPVRRSSMSKYIYQSLRHDDSIRVLVLEPAGRDDDPIRCRLEEKRLSENPQYEAVSYAWGEPEPTHPIFIDGAEWDIRDNLFLGLRQFRKELKGMS